MPVKERMIPTGHQTLLAPWWEAGETDPWEPIERGGPSPHLTWEALAWIDPVAHTYAPYPPMLRTSKLPGLVEAWEATVAWLGGTPTVIRGYWERSQTMTLRFRRYRESGHVLGTALDVTPPRGMSLDTMYDLVRAGVRGTSVSKHRLRNGPLHWKSVIAYPDHLHLDTAGLARIKRVVPCTYPPPRCGAPLYRVA